MSSTKKHEYEVASWEQLEDFLDELHEMARQPLAAQDFYRKLLDGCISTLAATGGAVWAPSAGGNWTLLHQVDLRSVFRSDDVDQRTVHYALLRAASTKQEPQLYPPHSGGAQAALENPTDAMLALAAVQAETPNQTGQPKAVVELYLRSASGPAVHRGWQEVLSTVSQIAATFHTLNELRTLRSERRMHHDSLALLNRIHGSTDLKQTAFEIANEGRRLSDADRLSVVLRCGRKWRLQAVSGVDRIEKRGDATKRLQLLADRTARWGEPIEYGTEQAGEEILESKDELPPELLKLLDRHADESHVRRLVAVPLNYTQDKTIAHSQRAISKQTSAVLIAEQFSSDSTEFSCQRVVELAGLCEPALQQAARLDRFPLRTLVHWSQRFSFLSVVWRLFKWTLVGLTVAAIVAALVYVPYDFEIEAPATLVPNVQREVFSPTDGTVTELHVSHGEQVAPGDVLAEIHAPELLLDSQRVQGEIETVQKRMEAIAIARTERLVREDLSAQSSPLSAETEQLQQRLASLRRQLEILEARRDALIVRSPIAGTVLTLDIQNLLQTRPVERGQVLFTVADTEAGWMLLADLSQDHLGHVVEAMRNTQEDLPVRIRLAGDTSGVYPGHLESISTTAILDESQLLENAPVLQVRVAIDEQELPAARPGMTADVRFSCGKRPLGYVWLHDIWETIYSWWVF